MHNSQHLDTDLNTAAFLMPDGMRTGVTSMANLRHTARYVSSAEPVDYAYGAL